MSEKKVKTMLKRKISQRHWKKKINRIYSNIKYKENNIVTKNDKNVVLNYWNDYSTLHSLKWHKAYSSVYKSTEVEKFVPEDAFYMEIEPKLNNVGLAKAYEDKNIYHYFFDKSIMPKVIIRNIHGSFFDQDYNEIDNLSVRNIFGDEKVSYIIKPSLDTQKGKNVNKLLVNNGNLYLNEQEYSDVNSLSETYGSDFLVQEIVKQHETLANIYPHSLNTIRIITLRVNNKVQCGSAVIRFGNEKRFVDNRGIACGISEDGKIKSYGTFLNMSKCYKHPFNDVEFSDIQIPNYNELKRFVIDLHSKLLYFDMVSWDIAIDEKGDFKMIEYNLKGQEINFHQINNGPLFGNNTTGILKKVYN